MITQDQVVDYLKVVRMTELKLLITALEEELGVTAQAPQMIVPQQQVVVEEQTEFDVVLTGYTGKKVTVIQAVRKLTSLGLKESKKLVEDAPSPIREGVSKEQAEEVAAALQAADGTVEIR